MNERRLVLLGYGFVLGAVSTSVCRDYPGEEIEALRLVVLSAVIALLITKLLIENLRAFTRR